MGGSVGGWIEGGQPRYLITRNMKTQVSSMPPIMMNLSWVARLSISLITVFDSPNMLATSSIFLWVPCVEPKQSRVSSTGRGLHVHIVLGKLGHYMTTMQLSTLIHLILGVANTLPDAPLRQKFPMARQPGYMCRSTDTP